MESAITMTGTGVAFRPVSREAAILQAVHEAASILLRSTTLEDDIATVLARLAVAVPACRAFVLEIDREVNGTLRANWQQEWMSTPGPAMHDGACGCLPIGADASD